MRPLNFRDALKISSFVTASGEYTKVRPLLRTFISESLRGKFPIFCILSIGLVLAICLCKYFLTEFLCFLFSFLSFLLCPNILRRVGILGALSSAAKIKDAQCKCEKFATCLEKFIQ